MAEQTAEDPRAVVEQQLEAYNDGDIDRFAELFAPDGAVVHLGIDREPLEGRDAIRDEYGALFEENPTLRCETGEWLVVGNTVSVHEQLFTDDGQLSETLARYRVEDGLITHLWLPGL